MSNLPTTTPAEALEISPEALEVSNAYIQNPNIQSVSDALGIPTDLVAHYLSKREVKAYIDQIYMNLGFNNKFQLSDLMDTLIKKKLQDMDEADVGSTKDITEILALKQKMIKDQMDHELAMAKLSASNVKTQTNIQINDSGGNKYSALIEKLLSNGDVVDV